MIRGNARYTYRVKLMRNVMIHDERIIDPVKGQFVKDYDVNEPCYMTLFNYKIAINFELMRF